MSADQTRPTIIQALAAVMVECREVAKGSTNQAQGYAYRSTDDVLIAVAPSLRRHRIVTVPEVESVTYAAVEYGAKKTAMTSARLVVAYKLYGPAGDHIVTKVAAEAADTADKAVLKAMTLAYRTALVQVLALPVADAAAITPQQLKKLMALFNRANIKDREDRLRFASEVVGRELETSKDMTSFEAAEVIDALEMGLAEDKSEAPS